MFSVGVAAVFCSVHSVLGDGWMFFVGCFDALGMNMQRGKVVRIVSLDRAM
jgi:hypothetical protein